MSLDKYKRLVNMYYLGYCVEGEAVFGNALGLRGLWVETGNARRFGEFITDAIGYQHPSDIILEWTKREDSRLQVRPGRRWFGF